jgi:hypothetical protein
MTLPVQAGRCGENGGNVMRINRETCIVGENEQVGIR